MSDMLKQEQQQALETSSDNHVSTRETNIQQQLKLEPSSPPSNETMTMSSIQKESQEDSNFDQQVRNRDAVIPLDDCMKCFVQLPHCQANTKIKQEADRSHTTSKPTIEQQLREWREEQEKL